MQINSRKYQVFCLNWSSTTTFLFSSSSLNAWNVVKETWNPLYPFLISIRLLNALNKVLSYPEHRSCILLLILKLNNKALWTWFHFETWFDGILISANNGEFTWDWMKLSEGWARLLVWNRFFFYHLFSVFQEEGEEPLTKFVVVREPNKL